MENYVCIERVQTFIFIIYPQTVQHNNYLYSIYIVLDIVANLQVIEVIWDEVQR